MRTINVRRKGNRTLFDIFKVDGGDPEQAVLLARSGYICYSECLLMSGNVQDSTVLVNGDWVFHDGHQVMFVYGNQINRFFEPPLGMYGGDLRTIEQVWRDSNGRT